MRRWAAWTAISIISGAAAADGPPRLASVTIENDFFAGYDRHYTNGIQVAFLVDRDAMPGFLRALPMGRRSEPQLVLAVGQRIYTPADSDSSVPDPADRPYAGWLYVMADVQTISGDVVDHVTMSVGVVGPAALGRQTQNAAHHLFGTKPAGGWDRQIGNEATVLLGFERAWRGVLSGGFDGERLDLSLRAGGALGNVFTYASTGAVLRFGRSLPSDLPVTHISLGPPRDGYRGAAQLGWYVWAGIDARAVARNIFIDGNSFRDGPSVHRKPFGYDLQLGAAVAWPHARVGFTVVRRSREFDRQASPDRFGQLALSFAY